MSAPQDRGWPGSAGCEPTPTRRPKLPRTLPSGRGSCRRMLLCQTDTVRVSSHGAVCRPVRWRDPRLRPCKDPPRQPPLEAFDDQRVENRDAQCECNTYKNTPPPIKAKDGGTSNQNATRCYTAHLAPWRALHPERHTISCVGCRVLIAT